MYDDPARVRDIVIKLRVNDYEHADLKVCADAAGRQLASYVHDLVMAQLDRDLARLAEKDEGPEKGRKTWRAPCRTSTYRSRPMSAPSSNATRSCAESRSMRP